ncbi:hypothetical protein IAD21_03208 [Abditibacteriota bacterium]|nr:hypothetical protein IAD21_03208 [Abditibacteriota bacterium]
MTPFYRFPNTVEIPESTPLIALEWEVIGSDLWLRPMQGDVEVAWCYLGQAALSERMRKSTRQKMAAKKMGKALAAKRLWRFWPSTTTEGELFLRREFGLIRLPDKPWLARFNFRGVFKNSSDVLNAKPRHLENLVRQLEERDDFQEALVWLRDYEDEWSNVYFERGSRQQLEALLVGFWALFHPLQSDSEAWYFVSILAEDHSLKWYWPDASFAKNKPVRRAARRLFELLHEYMVMKPLPQRPYSASAGKPEYMVTPRILVPAPSMHERMEALLIWREFLIDKISHDEIEALLPQF